MGMNENEEKKYKWLLEQMSKPELPDEYVKELDPDDNVVYYNNEQHLVYIEHPFLKNYQRMFMDFLNKDLTKEDKESIL